MARYIYRPTGVVVESTAQLSAALYEPVKAEEPKKQPAKRQPRKAKQTKE